MSKQQILTLVLLISPIFLVQLAMAIYSLKDLAQRALVRGPRGLWLALLVFGIFGVPTGIVISGVYLAWGRNVEQPDNDQD